MRHARFAIGEAERDAWLRHMRVALDELELDEALAAQFWDYLVMAAHSLINVEPAHGPDLGLKPALAGLIPSPFGPKKRTVSGRLRSGRYGAAAGDAAEMTP
jgi:hypothetical protein